MVHNIAYHAVCGRWIAKSKVGSDLNYVLLIMFTAQTNANIEQW